MKKIMPDTVPLKIQTEELRCIGCRICEYFCSLAHGGEITSYNTRIRIGTDLLTLENTIHLCRGCESHECENTCPTDALIYNSEKGLLEIHKDRCTYCGLCRDLECRGINFDDQKKQVIACDLCDEKPECVEVCPTRALYISIRSTL